MRAGWLRRPKPPCWRLTPTNAGSRTTRPRPSHLKRRRSRTTGKRQTVPRRAGPSAIRPDADVARAYARLAQISMMSGMQDIANQWGTQALAMGEKFGAEAVVVHALNTCGTSQICRGVEEGWDLLDESLRR